jgi:ATP-dependent Clp protease ATP-binding subunit ClpA
LTGISVFNELGEPEMMRIFDLELAKMNERIKESGHVIEIGDDVKEKIVKEVDTKFGARDLTRKLMELVSNDICEEMINSGKKVKEKIIVNLDKKNNIKIKFK